jgi:hypothetical protein
VFRSAKLNGDTRGWRLPAHRRYICAIAAKTGACVDSARPLDDVSRAALPASRPLDDEPRPDPDTARAIAALCAAHPGPTPLFIEWRGENGAGKETVRLRSRSFRVDAADDLLAALRDIGGVDAVNLVRA